MIFIRYFYIVYIVFFSYKYQQRINYFPTTNSCHSFRIVYFLSYYINICFTWFELFWCDKLNPIIDQSFIWLPLINPKFNFTFVSLIGVFLVLVNELNELLAFWPSESSSKQNPDPLSCILATTFSVDFSYIIKLISML